MFFLAHLTPLRRRFALISLIVFVFGAIGVLTEGLREYYGIRPLGGTYTEYIDQKISSLNPLFVTPGSMSSEILELIFSGLVRYDADTGEYLPDLASRYEIRDAAKEYRFWLREDARWHDGMPVTREDVMLTFSLYRSSDIKSGWMSTFANITVKENEDDGSFSFLLSSPDRFFMQVFVAPILPAHILSALEQDTIKESNFGTFPIGSGPFRVLELLPLKKKTLLKLAAFSSYHGEKKPNILNLDFLISEEFPTQYKNRISALRSKQKILDEDYLERFTKYEIKLPRYQTLFYNTTSEKLANEGTRRAINFLTHQISQNSDIDEKPLWDVFEDGKTNPFFEKDIDDQALQIKNLLFDAGWQIYTADFDDGLRRDFAKEVFYLNLYTTNDPALIKFAEELKSAALVYGIEIQIHHQDFQSLYYSTILFGDYDILLLNLSLNSNQDYYSYMHSTQKQNFNNHGKNFSFLHNLEIDLLLEDYRQSLDTEKQIRILAELQKRYEYFMPFTLVKAIPYYYHIDRSMEGYKTPEKPISISDRFFHFDQIYKKNR